MIPGPSVLFEISRSVALGRRAGLATVAGNAAGEFVQATAVAVGIGAIVQRSAPVFTVLKVAGAAYIVVLGIRAIRDRRALSEILDATMLPQFVTARGSSSPERLGTGSRALPAGWSWWAGPAGS